MRWQHCSRHHEYSQQPRRRPPVCNGTKHLTNATHAGDPIAGHKPPVKRAVLGQHGYLRNPNLATPNLDLSAQLDRDRSRSARGEQRTPSRFFHIVVGICRAFVPCLLGGDARDARSSTISPVFSPFALAI